MVDPAWISERLASFTATLPKFASSAAQTLNSSAASGGCYQGQTHGHEGFLVTRGAAEEMLIESVSRNEVLIPYLTADEMLGRRDCLPTRYVIDFGVRDALRSAQYKLPFAQVKNRVLATRQDRARNEAVRNDDALTDDSDGNVSKDHGSALARWWQLFRRRGEMLSAIEQLPRYIVCGRVTKRPVFEFVAPAIHPNDALTVFPFADDYSFEILQSVLHWEWFVARCSTLKGDL